MQRHELTGPVTAGWRMSALAPHAVVAAWVVFLAVALWQHALASVQPAWGDGLSYLWKAASFWSAVEQGRLFNPLNLFPSVRPPGTVLMSYPFGMTADVHGFHFRSVFLPLASVVIAVYVAAGAEQAKRNPWIVAAFALLLSSLPMFYWLDWNDEYWTNNGWGMVDNFQAGVAALAGAALVRSVFSRSQRWLVVAACLASLTFLVKQSGLMVMGTLGLAWLVALVLEWRIARPDARPLRTYAVGGMVRFAIVYGIVFVPSLFSAYFSSANFAYAMKALGFYRDVAPDVSISLFHHTSGEVAVAWMLVAAGLFVYYARKRIEIDRRPGALAIGFAAGAALTWLLGLLYWIGVQVGGNQVRYFHPFMLTGAILAVPALLQTWPAVATWMRAALVVVPVAAAVNIGLLLMAGHSPSLAWQKATGVSVSVGHHREEVANARALLATVRASGMDARVYFTPTSTPPQTFVFVGAAEKAVHPRLPTFEPVSPMDWTRGFVVRIDELLDSDYIVTRKFADRSAESRFAAKAFRTFDAESNAFDGWLSTLDARSGVETVSDGKAVRVLRIVDRALLASAVRNFVSRHDWRPEFVAANRPSPPPWTDARGAAEALAAPAVGPVTFQDLYVIQALAAYESDNGVRVDVWWQESKHDEANGRRYLFLHLIDAKGAILQSRQLSLFPYVPPSPDKRWRYATATFLDVLPNASIRGLAFGIYEPSRPDGGLLTSAGTGRTDWGGKRTLVPITPAGAASKPRSQ
jgi:hypothetical protein